MIRVWEGEKPEPLECSRASAVEDGVLDQEDMSSRLCASNRLRHTVGAQALLTMTMVAARGYNHMAAFNHRTIL